MSLANQQVNWVFALSRSVSCLYKVIKGAKILSPEYQTKQRGQWAGEMGT